MRTKPNPAFPSLTKLGGPGAGTVAALAVSQDHATTVFVGTRVGVFRSTAYDGKTVQGWVRLSTAPIGILSLSVSPAYAEDHTIVAGTQAGIFLSKDSGDTWLAAEMPISRCIAIAISFSPNYPRDGVLLAGTLEDGILYSDTRGEKWQSRNFGLLDATVYSLAFSPNFARDETAYAGTETAIYYSHNGARAWKQLNFSEDSAPALSLAISRNFVEDGTLYVGTETQGLYRSADRGESWRQLNLPPSCVNVLLIHKTQALMAATDAGIFLSSDQGETWQCLLDLAHVVSLVSMDDIAVAGLVDQGIWMTVDSVAWRPIPDLSARSLLGLVLSPQFDQDQVAILFGPEEGIWTTQDGGRNWICLNEGLPSLDIRALVLSPDFSKNHTVAAASPQGVLISDDAGHRWKRVTEEPVGLVAFSPNGTILAASLLQGGIRTTEDLGNTWLGIPGPWDSGGQVAALSVSNSRHYYVALVEGVGESLGIWQGTSDEFEKVLSQPAGKNPVISFFIPSQPAPDRPWYASLGHQVWKFSSRKGRPGVPTAVISSDERGESILALTGIQGPASQILLASTGQHLFQSLDAKSWTMVYDFGSERAISLALSPGYAIDRTVYVLLLGGSFCQGVIR